MTDLGMNNDLSRIDNKLRASSGFPSIKFYMPSRSPPGCGWHRPTQRSLGSGYAVVSGNLRPDQIRLDKNLLPNSSDNGPGLSPIGFATQTICTPSLKVETTLFVRTWLASLLIMGITRVGAVFGKRTGPARPLKQYELFKPSMSSRRGLPTFLESASSRFSLLTTQPLLYHETWYQSPARRHGCCPEE